MAQAALNLFTNYVNAAFAAPVDFPSVKLRRAACRIDRTGERHHLRPWVQAGCSICLSLSETPMKSFETAPPLVVSDWINTPGTLSLSALRGRVVMLHAFQMLCPGCVAHGLPQASKVREMFAENDVAVIGLHTVFEHHEVMGANALKAFIHEYRLTFPIGIDKRGSGDIPLTMQAYALQGTPSLVLIDRLGRVRLNHFGRIEDMALGALIGQLSAESSMSHAATHGVSATAVPDAGCNDEACVGK